MCSKTRETAQNKHWKLRHRCICRLSFQFGLARLHIRTEGVYIEDSVYPFLVNRREGQDTMMMFTRMLRRQGFYRVKNQDEPVYMKHNVGLGGVYVRIENKKAMLTVRDLGIEAEFTRVKQLENYITDLDEQAYRQKCFIVHKMRGTAGS